MCSTGHVSTQPQHVCMPCLPQDPDPGKREASGKKEASAAVPIPGACDLSCDNQVTSTSTEEPLSQPTAVAIDIEVCFNTPVLRDAVVRMFVVHCRLYLRMS